MRNYLLAAIRMLGILGCNGSGGRLLLALIFAVSFVSCGGGNPSSQSGAYQNPVAGLIAVPYVRPPGLPPQVLPPAPVTSIALITSGAANVAPLGSITKLSVLVTDSFGNPFAGAGVSFMAADPARGPYGLGTATSNALGVAQVAAIPAVLGNAIVDVTASSTYAPAVKATLILIGQ